MIGAWKIFFTTFGVMFLVVAFAGEKAVRYVSGDLFVLFGVLIRAGT